MKLISFIYLIPIWAMLACSGEHVEVEPLKINWSERELDVLPTDSTLEIGSSYLSIYSEIYSQNEKNTRGLTVTVSMRNPNMDDTLYMTDIHSYNTSGEEIKQFVKKPVFIRPMETLELVIEEDDNHNGTGGNLILDWAHKKGNVDPIFEAVMISTAGQQGISFVTTAKRIH